MKLLIDISKNDYEEIKEYGINTFSSLAIAIQNGIPLPEGHGRIIAEPTEGDIAKTIGGQNDFAECIREAVKAVFDNAQTIIEADKENKE